MRMQIYSRDVGNGKYAVAGYAEGEFPGGSDRQMMLVSDTAVQTISIERYSEQLDGYTASEVNDGYQLTVDMFGTRCWSLPVQATRCGCLMLNEVENVALSPSGARSWVVAGIGGGEGWAEYGNRIVEFSMDPNRILDIEMGPDQGGKFTGESMLALPRAAIWGWGEEKVTLPESYRLEAGRAISFAAEIDLRQIVGEPISDHQLETLLEFRKNDAVRYLLPSNMANREKDYHSFLVGMHERGALFGNTGSLTASQVEEKTRHSMEVIRQLVPNTDLAAPSI